MLSQRRRWTGDTRRRLVEPPVRLCAQDVAPAGLLQERGHVLRLHLWIAQQALGDRGGLLELADWDPGVTKAMHPFRARSHTEHVREQRDQHTSVLYARGRRREARVAR